MKKKISSLSHTKYYLVLIGQLPAEVKIWIKEGIHNQEKAFVVNWLSSSDLNPTPPCQRRCQYHMNTAQGLTL